MKMFMSLSKSHKIPLHILILHYVYMRKMKKNEIKNVIVTPESRRMENTFGRVTSNERFDD